MTKNKSHSSQLEIKFDFDSNAIDTRNSIKKGKVISLESALKKYERLTIEKILALSDHINI